ncbi:MAG: hypothetical protein J6T70_09825, partial [Bacteroidales bacterium]|nr:hypothetical protein [Bacteroidales bacterium]
MAFFANYITDFDVTKPTQWWFTIKDSEYDLTQLQAKKRYEITKARKYCNTCEINPFDYINELFDCYKESFTAYSKHFGVGDIDFSSFLKYITSLKNEGCNHFYATFFNESSKLIGFLIITIKDNIVYLKQQKTNPRYEKFNSNAALIDFVLTQYNEQLKVKSVMFSNGSRNIKHETNFNAYLEKYFGFRKAYSKLCVVYRFPFGLIVKMLKPFMNFFEHSESPFLYNIFCVLKMDSFKYVV